MVRAEPLGFIRFRWRRRWVRRGGRSEISRTGHAQHQDSLWLRDSMSEGQSSEENGRQADRDRHGHGQANRAVLCVINLAHQFARDSTTQRRRMIEPGRGNGRISRRSLGVAQISNLPYRRIGFCVTPARSSASESFDALPMANRRYGRLKSALRRQGPDNGSNAFQVMETLHPHPNFFRRQADVLAPPSLASNHADHHAGASVLVGLNDHGNGSGAKPLHRRPHAAEADFLPP